MSTPVFITDPLHRRALANLGYDPDDPRTVAQIILPRGLDPGAQPRTDLLGDVQAFGRGAAGSVSNTLRGIGDLPLALGRMTGMTDARIDPRTPSFVEQANPAAAGFGSLTSTLAQMLFGGAALGRISALSRLSNAGRLAELGPLGLSTGRASVAQSSFLSGLQPTAMLGRGAQTGASFGLLELLQPGDIHERVGRAAEGTARGFVLGALGAPRGTPYIKSTLRDSLAGLAAFGNEPVIEGLDAIPPLVQNLAFGAGVGVFTAKRKTRKQTTTSLLNRVRSEGGQIIVEDVPTIIEGREILPLPSYDRRAVELDNLISRAGELPDDIRTNLYQSGLVRWINDSRAQSRPRSATPLEDYATESTAPRSRDLEIIINSAPDKRESVDIPIVGRPVGIYESRYGEAGKRFDEALAADRGTIRAIIDPSDSASTRVGASEPVIVFERGEQFDPFTGARVEPTGKLFDLHNRELDAVRTQPARMSRKIYLPGESAPSKLESRVSPSDILRTRDLPIEKIDDIDLDTFDASTRRRLSRIERAAREGRALSRASAEVDTPPRARKLGAARVRAHAAITNKLILESQVKRESRSRIGRVLKRLQKLCKDIS